MNILKHNFFLILAVGLLQNGFSQVEINTRNLLSTLDICGNLNVKEIGLVNANVSGSATFYGGPSGSATHIDD